MAAIDSEDTFAGAMEATKRVMPCSRSAPGKERLDGLHRVSLPLMLGKDHVPDLHLSAGARRVMEADLADHRSILPPHDGTQQPRLLVRIGLHLSQPQM